MNTPAVTIVTIDGLSATGKGTIARMLANHLGYHLLESGNVYRTLALFMQQYDLQVEDANFASRFHEIIAGFDCNIREDHAGETHYFLGTRDVSHEIGNENVARMTSQLAVMPVVRDYVTTFLRTFAKTPGLVAEGRDMGTHVFPKAQHKFFLSASAEIRAKRRFKQLQHGAQDGSILDLLREIKARDSRDANRQYVPTKAAADAHCIDTSELNPKEVIEQLLTLLQT